jgi:hypothetical protein
MTKKIMIDAFGEPADMGTLIFAEGFSGGFDDDPLLQGRSRASSWGSKQRGKKVGVACRYGVALADASKWKSSR